MSELARQLEEHFRGVTNERLVHKMEAAPDFGYDDEAYELERRLNLISMAWKWSQKHGRDVVVIYTPPAAEVEGESPNEVRAYD